MSLSKSHRSTPRAVIAASKILRLKTAPVSSVYNPTTSPWKHPIAAAVSANIVWIVANWPVCSPVVDCNEVTSVLIKLTSVCNGGI
ncbi:MAG: hypothetical protein Ta2E_12390 [Mycoplasmoidaceae bacterium]|nr:MAG: hypothetical protein Ta2E_12390 [Mycoplasmoidaceae bacterium]